MLNVVESDLKGNSKLSLIFMLMPFEKDLTNIYEQYIKEPLISKGYNVKRADDFYRSTDILADILNSISDADIIIAAIGKPHFVTADMVKDGAIDGEGCFW